MLRWLSYIILAHLPRDGVTHSRLSVPISIINQDILLQTWAQASLILATPQMKFPLPGALKVLSRWQYKLARMGAEEKGRL